MNFDCIFAKKVNSTEFEVVPFEEIHQSIQDGSYKQIVTNLRNIKDKTDFGNYKKDNFPQFTIGSFKDNIRRGENLISVKHFMFDIDKVSDDKLNEVRKKLIANKYCYCFFTSCSGKGIKAIFETEEIFVSVERFKIVYEHYRLDLEKNLGVELDKTINPSHGSYLSYDENIFLNTENSLLTSNHIRAKEIEKSNIDVPSGKYFTETDKNRNSTLTSYLGLLHSNGDGYDIIKFNAHCYNTNYFNPPLPENEVNTIINSVTKYKIVKEVKEFKSYDLLESFDDYWSFTKTGDENRISTTINAFDSQMMGGVMVGEKFGLVALTGGFKTVYQLNLNIKSAEKLSAGYCNVINSLEMSKRILVQRILQILTSRSGKEIWHFGKNNDVNYKKLAIEILKKFNIEIVEKRFNVNEFPEIINRIQDKRGQKVCMATIDHNGLVMSNYKSEYDRNSEIADNFIQYGKELDIAIFELHQAPRVDVKDVKKITLHSFKGSGNIENALRYAIVFNNIYPNNCQSYGIELPDYTTAIKNNFLINASLEKNHVGGININQILMVDKKNLQMKQYFNLGEQTTAQF